MAVIVDSYSESNQDNAFRFFPDSSVEQMGQSFTGAAGVLDSAKLYIKRTNTLGGTMVIKIYAHTGTFGTDGTPTGAVLATSDTINIADIPTSYTLMTFNFTGAERITLVAGTKYFVTFDTSGMTGSTSNFIDIGEDSSSASHGGNIASFFGGAWHAIFASTDDYIFYVYREEASSPSPSLSPSASRSPSASDSPSFSLSPSASLSPSSSISLSASASLSPSASISPSASRSPSASLSPSFSASPSPEIAIMKVAKSGINALQDLRPEKYKFHSKFGTLKYFTKQQVNISFDASTLDISASGSYSHNLGIYPYCEIFVRVYVGSTPSGNYEYVPFAGAGATVFYSAIAKITTSQIVVYGMIDGVSSSVWHFDFLIFVYKNDLQLS